MPLPLLLLALAGAAALVLAGKKKAPPAPPGAPGPRGAPPLMVGPRGKLQAAPGRADFEALSERERELVIASEYIIQSLGAVVAEIELPFVHKSGIDEQVARGQFYGLLEGYKLSRFPLVLEPAAKVYLLEVGRASGFPPVFSGPWLEHDLQLPPPHVPPPDPYPCWSVAGCGVLVDSNDTDMKPAGWWASVIFNSIGEARLFREAKPWEPDLETAPMPPGWLLDAGRALRDLVALDNETLQDIANALAGAVTDAMAESLAGAERVFSATDPRPATIARREQVLEVITAIVATCQFWAAYRYWEWSEAEGIAVVTAQAQPEPQVYVSP